MLSRTHFKEFTLWIVGIGFFLASPLAWADAYSAFFDAVRNDRAAVVRQWLQRGFDPNTLNPEGVPALVYALQEQSFASAQTLLSHPETRVELRNPVDESALMLAALRGQSALVVDLVLRGGKVNKSGWTPLHYAATGGHPSIVAFLLGAQADIDAQSPNGTTPLMMAAMYGNEPTVRLLLESGADPRIGNQLALTAVDFAKRGGNEASLRLIQAVIDRLEQEEAR